MVTTARLLDIENKLAHYYGLSTRTEFVAQALTNSGEVGAASSIQTPPDVFAEAVVDLQQSGKFAYEIIETLSAAMQDAPPAEAQKWLRQFEFHSGNGSSNSSNIRVWPIQPMITDPNIKLDHQAAQAGKSSKNIAFMLVNNIQLVPAKKNGNIVSLFLNAIPSVELSKCVPFLQVDISTGRETFKNDQLQGLSLHRFLQGTVDEDAASLAGTTRNTAGVSDRRFAGTIAETHNQTGMEIFLSPQTLVPAGDISTAAPIIDRFRPFMSITQFIVDVVPAAGMMAYKSGKLGLVLHDRSRLAEIADLINPNLFSRVELLIEFGWSHPDSIEQKGVIGTNIYGDLINAMRVREKYGIRNVSFNFTTNGQVEIELDIYIKGAAQLKTLDINADTKQTEQLDAIIAIKETIANLTRNRDVNNSIREIRAAQLLGIATNSSAPLVPLSAEDRAELTRLSRMTNPDIVRIRKLVEQLYGKKGRGGLVTEAVSDARARIDGMFKDLFSAESVDAFIFEGDQNPKIQPGAIGIVGQQESRRAKRRIKYFIQRLHGRGRERHGHSRYDFVSTGKLLTRLVAQPLIASGQFDEVQILTYPLNESAGYSGGLNIAHFPINQTKFTKRFSTLLARRNNTHVSIADFLVFLNNAFFDDSGHPNYGLQYVFNSKWNEKTLTVQNELSRAAVRHVQRGAKKGQTVQSLISGLLKDTYGLNNGKFVQPHLDVIVEAYPAGANDDRTILRLHVFDSAATPYATLKDLLAAHRGDELFNITSDASAELAKISGNDADGLESMRHARAQLVQRLLTADNLGLFETEKIGSGLIIKGGATGMKDVIMQSVPSIVYGSNNTAITDAQLSSVHIPELSTVHMLRHGVDNAMMPSGQGPGGLPLRIIPTQLELSTFGCPLFAYAQQFFIDFGTNTTADNIYGIIKLTHEIHPGGYQSKASLWPIDAYGQYESPFKLLDDFNEIIDDAERKASAETLAGSRARRRVDAATGFGDTNQF